MCGAKRPTGILVYHLLTIQHPMSTNLVAKLQLANAAFDTLARLLEMYPTPRKVKLLKHCIQLLWFIGAKSLACQFHSGTEPQPPFEILRRRDNLRKRRTDDGGRFWWHWLYQRF